MFKYLNIIIVVKKYQNEYNTELLEAVHTFAK